MKVRISVLLLLLAVCCVPLRARAAQTPQKDFYDKALVWANIALAVFGFGGTGVAVWTLLTIKRQVNTFVSKERARITVDIEPIKQSGSEGNGIPFPNSNMPPPSGEIWYADLSITNSGETNAFIRHSLCKACIRPIRWDPRRESITSQIGLPKVLHPHAEAFRHRARIETGSNLRLELDRETAQAIADGSLGIYVIGHIEFGDVFDNCWTEKFCRKWGAWWLGGAWQEKAFWYDYSNGMNGEFRIKRSSLPRRLWRRMRKKDPYFPVVELSD